MVTYQSLMIHD